MAEPQTCWWNKESLSQDLAGNGIVMTCHLAMLLPSPRLLIISPSLPHPLKQEDYQTDVFSHCLRHPQAREGGFWQ